MGLPSSIDPTAPASGDAVSLGDDQIRALKLAIIDIFGLPTSPTAISVALFEAVAGGLKVIKFQDAAGNPGTAGYLQRNATRLVYHNGTTSVTLATTAEVTAATFGGNFTNLAGTIAIGQIPDDLITYAKLQNVAAAPLLLGRGIAEGTGPGNVQEISLGSGLDLTGTTLFVSNPVPAAPLVTDPIAVSIATGATTNRLGHIEIADNTINAFTIKITVNGYTGGSGGKGGSPASIVTVSHDYVTTHSIGRVQNLTPWFAITSTADPFTGTLKVAYS